MPLLVRIMCGLTDGIPRGRLLPSLFGIMTRLTGSGLYVLFLSASSSSAMNAGAESVNDFETLIPIEWIVNEVNAIMTNGVFMRPTVGSVKLNQRQTDKSIPRLPPPALNCL
jgi:hypothetical protein